MQEKILEILKLRAELAEMEAAYKKAAEPLKVQRDELQNTILETMRSEGEFSKRYETATISRAVRKTWLNISRFRDFQRNMLNSD